MSGAVDSQVGDSDVFVVRQSPSWAPWYVDETPNRYLYRSQCLRNPDHTSNPKDQFGQRPRAPWSKDWFRAVIPISTWSTRPKGGVSAWFHPDCTTPVAGGLLWFDQWSNNVPRFRPSPLDRFYCEQVARTKVLQEVSQKKWDLGVTALEMKQTAGLVTDLATGMVNTVFAAMDLRKNSRRQINDLFRSTRRNGGDFAKAASEVGMKDIGLLNACRDRWMQYQFGIKPALNDIQNAVEALNEVFQQPSADTLVTARAGHQVDGHIVVPLQVVNAPFTTNVRLRTEVRCHASVSYKVPTEGIPNLTVLGLDNPYSTLWEGTKLSWMFDYVVGMGDWMQSWTAANGLIFVDGSLSTLWRSVSDDVKIELTPNDLEWDKRPRQTGLYIEAGSFVREMLTSGVTPGIVPQIKSELGLVQMANSIFALTSVLGGSPALR